MLPACLGLKELVILGRMRIEDMASQSLLQCGAPSYGILGPYFYEDNQNNNVALNGHELLKLKY